MHEIINVVLGQGGIYKGNFFLRYIVFNTQL